MKIELSEIQEKEVVNLICDCYKSSKDRYSQFYELCGYLERLYQVKLPDDLKGDLEEENPGLMPADAHIGVNELLAQFDDILFSSDPFFRCVGGENTNEKKTRNITSYLKTATYHSKFKRSYRPTLKSAIMFGVGWGYVDVEKIALDAPRENLYLEFPQGLQNKFLCPTYKRCDLRRFFPDPDNLDFKWAIHQTKVTLLDLLEEEGKDEEIKRFDIDIDKIRASQFPGSDFEEFFPSGDFRSNTMKSYNLPVELLHFRGWIPIPNDDPDGIIEFRDVIATIANREILIQFDENELHYPAVKTFIPTFIFPEDDEFFYPISKLGTSASALLQKFYIRNRQLMALARVLDTPYWTDDQSKDFPDYIQAKSGDVIKVSRGSKFEPIKTAEVSKESYLETNNITNEIQYIFGSNQFSAGISPPREQLATGIMVLKGVTDKLRKFESQIIVDTGLVEILQRYRDIGRLYLEGMPVKAFDTGEIIDMSSEDIDEPGIDIQIQINDVWNQPIQRQEMLQLAKIYKDDPFVDPVKFRRKHFRLIQLTEVDELVPDPKEKMIPIEKENQTMVQYGIVLPVHPLEDDDLHLKGHAPFKDVPNVAQHMQLHIASAQRKQGGGNGKRVNAKIPMAENELDLVQQTAQRFKPQSVLE